MRIRRRSLPRRLAVVAVGGVLVAAIGVTSASGAVAPNQRIDHAVGYSCTVAGLGEQPVRARFTATVPGEVAPGVAYQPAEVAVELTLPPSLVARFREGGGVSTAATATTKVTATQNGAAAEAVWRDLLVPTTPLPETGDLVATASGKVPAITPQQGGDLVLTAGAIEADFVAHKADGAPTEAPLTHLTCAPAPDQNTTLAKIPARPEAAAPDTKKDCEPGQQDCKPSVANESEPNRPQAAAPIPVSRSWAATCSGAIPLRIELAATFPGGYLYKVPFTVSDITFRLVVPEESVARLRGTGGTTIQSSAPPGSVFTRQSLDGASTNANWTGLTFPQTPIPASGPMTLTSAPMTRSFNFQGMGTVAISLTQLLNVRLQARNAAGTITQNNLLTCTPTAGQDLTIVSIPRQPSPMPGPEDRLCSQFAHANLNRNPFEGTNVIKKLDAKVPLGPGMSEACQIFFYWEQAPPNGVIELMDERGLLHSFYDGPTKLPPSETSALLYGFMPVTATTEFIPVGMNNLHLSERIDPATGKKIPKPGGGTATFLEARQYQIARVSNLRVNGVPYDVGPNCQSAQPIEVVLRSAGHYDVLRGGPVSGEVTIPPFTGCGVSEDVSRLLTGTISGPGNPVNAMVDLDCRLGPTNPKPCVDYPPTPWEDWPGPKR